MAATSQAPSVALGALTSQWRDALSELDSSGVALISRILEEEAAYGEVRLSVERYGAGWRVALSMDARSNALPLVAGLLTSNGLDIYQADIFTIEATAHAHRRRPSRRPRSQDSGPRKRPRPRPHYATRGAQRRLAMLFELGDPPDAAPEWDKIEQEIRTAAKQALTGRTESATSTVIDRYAEAMRERKRLGDNRLPVDILTDIESSERYTLMAITSIDTPGFLFSFTNALASIHVNIARAKIRTLNHDVRDTFWLTDSSGNKMQSDRSLGQLRTAAALIKQFTHFLPVAPDPAQALRQFNSLTSQLLAMHDWTSKLQDLDSPDVLETLAKMMGASRFLWEDFLRMQHDNLFPILLDADSLDKPLSSEYLQSSIDSDLDACHTHEERARALNDFKDREMFRVNLRFITGRVGVRRFSRELTRVADTLIRTAFDISLHFASARHGLPRLEDGSICGWGIFALGKFGGRDMGFGSDIELIFVYDSEGLTDGQHPVRVSTFFEEVVKEFLHVLETRPQGIFEIDMRLRPYGSKGPLASSLAAFQSYYSTSGDSRQFERLAMVRMRPVAGDDKLTRHVMAAQDSFVYSTEPLDISDILHLRHRQATELVEMGAVNAKVGSGGVVDIEYYIQAWQIARGAQDPDLRLTNTLEAVDALCAKGHISRALALRLAQAYTFLRKLIDGLRIVRGNAKDLHAPPTDSKEFQRLAHRMAEESSEDLAVHISRHMEFSRRLWEDRPLPTP